MTVSGLVKEGEQLLANPATANIISRAGDVLLKGAADVGRVVVPIVAGGAAISIGAGLAGPALGAAVSDVGRGVGQGVALVGGNTQLAERIAQISYQPPFHTTLPNTSEPSNQYSTIPTTTGSGQVVVVPVPTNNSQNTQSQAISGNIVTIGVLGLLVLGGAYFVLRK